MKKLIAELTIKNNLSKNVYEGLSNEGKDILKYISKENGGKITINDEGTEYIFKKTKNMFEGIEKTKMPEEKKEENKIEDKKEEGKSGEMELLENKIVDQNNSDPNKENENNDANNKVNEEN